MNRQYLLGRFDDFFMEKPWFRRPTTGRRVVTINSSENIHREKTVSKVPTNEPACAGLQKCA